MTKDSLAFHRIGSVKVIGGFLDGLDLQFSSGLNCLIGPRGTGKSTVLELIRFALDLLPGREGDSLRRRAESLVQNNLDGGRVELRVETRHGTKFVVTRSFGEAPIVVDERQNPVSLRVRGAPLFAADILSQNEIESIAETADYQLDLLDKFRQSELADLSWKLEELGQKLDGNRGSLLPLYAKRLSLEAEIRELPAIEEKLAGYAENEGPEASAINQAHHEKEVRDRETKAFTLLREVPAEVSRKLRASRGVEARQLQEMVDEEILAGPNKKEIRLLISDLGDLSNEIAANFESIDGLLERYRSRVDQTREKLRGAHDRQEIEYRKIVEKQKALQAKSSERAKLAKARNDLLFRKRELTEVAREIVRLETERLELLDHLTTTRTERSQVRRDVAEELNSSLQPNIRVRVIESGDRTNYQQLLAKALTGKGIRHQDVSRKVAAFISPGELGEIVKRHDVQELMTQTGIKPDQAEVVCRLETERLLELEAVAIEDRPTIELSDAGNYKESTVLSTGQKCTAILPILLFDSINPLLIDQPEDNLDNSYVFETIVPCLRKAKLKRQLIFVTHNPNIPVLAEASRVIVMRSDGKAGRANHEGTVDECRDDIVTLLEGGEKAFKERQARYRY